MRAAPSLFLATLLIAGPALAEEAPVATARPETAMTTAQQIDAYLKASPVLQTEVPGELAGVVPSVRDDGKVHGMVSVGVGTGGYRSVYARTDMPLGENGRLSLAFEDTRFGRGQGHGYAPGRFDRFGAGLSFGVDRQSCDLEGLTPPRPLDNGRVSRCARGAELP